MNKIRKYPLSLNTSSPVYGIGILTDESDYRLCWLLNQNFQWELSRTDDITVNDNKSPVPQTYGCFMSNPAHQPVVRIICNRSKEGSWLTVFRQVDFLLVTSSPDSSTDNLDDLKKILMSKIPQIRGLFKVPLPSFCYL
jgi:hypothetical protein